MEEITKEQSSLILKEHNNYFKTGETKSIAFRIKQLQKLKNTIIKNEKDIMDALYKDLHKSEFEAYGSEVGFILDSISYFMKNLKKWSKPKRVKTPYMHFGGKSYIYSEPYGTVLIIGPYNYPFQLILEPLIGAIAAGNCAVVKPSEFTTNIANIIEKIINEAFPKEYIRVVQGGKDTNVALINSPYDYIFFTGSAKVGKIVMASAAQNLTPVTLELGGKSPCIVHKDANLRNIVSRIAWGKFTNAGQTCVAPDYILVHKDIKSQLITELKKTIREFYGERPQESKDFARIVNEIQFQRLINLIDNEKVVLGGEYNLEDLYIAPTVLDNVQWDDKVMEDEIFGPILPILEYEDLELTIKEINSRPKPLALYIFTEDKIIQKRLIDSISYGGGCINDTISHIVTPNMPFGGVGASGIGQYHGKASFETFSHKKAILKKSTKFDLKLIYPPYNSKKVALIRRIFK